MKRISGIVVAKGLIEFMPMPERKNPCASPMTAPLPVKARLYPKAAQRLETRAMATKLWPIVDNTFFLRTMPQLSKARAGIVIMRTSPVATSIHAVSAPSILADSHDFPRLAVDVEAAQREPFDPARPGCERLPRSALAVSERTESTGGFPNRLSSDSWFPPREGGGGDGAFR